MCVLYQCRSLLLESPMAVDKSWVLFHSSHFCKFSISSLMLHFSQLWSVPKRSSLTVSSVSSSETSVNMSPFQSVVILGWLFIQLHECRFHWSQVYDFFHASIYNKLSSLVLDKSLFYSPPGLQSISFFLFTRITCSIITRVSDFNCLQILWSKPWTISVLLKCSI